MKDELFKEAPARFRGSVHRGKMAVFTYKMFPFFGGLPKEAARHSGAQLESLKSTHVRPEDARLLPWKRNAHPLS